MTRIERTMTIHRPVEAVFAYLCDVEHGPSYKELLAVTRITAAKGW